MEKSNANDVVRPFENRLIHRLTTLLNPSISIVPFSFDLVNINVINLEQKELMI